MRKLFCYLFVFFICLPVLARDETYTLILTDIFYPGFNREQNQLLKKQIMEGKVEISAMIWQPPESTYHFGWEPILCINTHGYKNCIIEHGYPKVEKKTYSRSKTFAEAQRQPSVDKNKIIFTVKGLEKKNHLSGLYIKVNNVIILNNSKTHTVDSELYLPMIAQRNYLTTDLNKDFLIARFELIRPQKKSFFSSQPIKNQQDNANLSEEEIYNTSLTFTRQAFSQSKVTQKHVVVPLIPHWKDYKKLSMGSTQVYGFKITMLEALKKEDKTRNIESWITQQGKLMMIMGVREEVGCSFFYRIPITPYKFDDRKYNVRLSKRLLMYKPENSDEDREVFFTPENLPVMEKNIAKDINNNCMTPWSSVLPLLKMSPEELQKQYDLYLKD